MEYQNSDPSGTLTRVTPNSSADKPLALLKYTNTNNSDLLSCDASIFCKSMLQTFIMQMLV